MRPYSFIILSYNEELHLSRLFDSIIDLHAAIYVLDSGSIDQSNNIYKRYGITVSYHPFENHPKQWHEALQRFPIETEWIIALDADQVVTPSLYKLLDNFNDTHYAGISGIYFNRKNFYKGKWIKHGGYFPFYMLKMFRYKNGFSDLNENMDHRFLVSGQTAIWKEGYLLEENLKENNVSFWIDKHNRYSDQVALEEVERMLKLRFQLTKPKPFGTPTERKALLKTIWWKLPRYFRPFLYFSYRLIFRLGILDGRTGIIFHFLQAFWFRLIVDIKIEELLKETVESQNALLVTSNHAMEVLPALNAINHSTWHYKLYTKLIRISKRRPIVVYGKEQRFIFKFLFLFAIGYGFNMAIIGISAPGGMYWSFADQHLNYIKSWRTFDLQSTAWFLRTFGFQVITNWNSLWVSGYAGFKLVYSCLGYGIMSLFTAFVIAYPKRCQEKLSMIFIGLVMIQLLNMVRFILIALYWKKPTSMYWPDHHTLWNALIYLLIFMLLYHWTKTQHHALYQIKKGF